MSHDPERDAAAFLGGAMRARRRRRFESHLLDCEDCWREVAAGRRGRQLAESTRELAPQALRETVRAAVAALPVQRRRVGVPLIGVALLVLAAGSFAAVTQLSQDQPPPIARAVADFRQGRMPTEAASGSVAPDLGSLRLSLTSSGSGSLDGLHVDAYSYRDPNGHRLLLYLSEVTFPVAAGARQARSDGPWRARIDDLELLCSSEPHALLAISDDAVLLDRLARQLQIEGVPA